MWRGIVHESVMLKLVFCGECNVKTDHSKIWEVETNSIGGCDVEMDRTGDFNVGDGSHW